MVRRSLLLRAASSAAWFTRFASLAPVYPTVELAMNSTSMSSAHGRSRRCTPRISARPRSSGAPTVILRSKRPGRTSAWSRMSGRLVAAMITTSTRSPMPSMLTSSWFSVWLRSCCFGSFVRSRPSASSSSMNTTAGSFALACLKRSRTLAEPVPTYTSTNSEALQLKKDTPASPATALAISVLPVPGGPAMSTPRGRRLPVSKYISGLRKKSTISSSWSFALPMPATSSK